MLSLLTLSLFAVGAPLPPPKVPQGPAPVVKVVHVDKNGLRYLEFRTIMPVPVTRQETVRIDDKEITVTTSVEFVPVVETRRIHLDAECAQVYDPDGKRVKPSEVQKLLVNTKQV